MAHALLRSVSRLVATLCLLAMACLPSFGASEEVCPWVNAATAGGVLGGRITNIKVKHALTGDDASCEFAQRDGSLLSVEVETMNSPAIDFPSYLARCHSPSEPLKAIGNTALACGDEGAEQVIGRVRNRAFIVRISTKDRPPNPAELREKARKVAEQVAGILF